MEATEGLTQSFIIKFWIEEPAKGTVPARWRGHITHVHSGERRYVEDLDEISAFITPYLSQMGVEKRGGGSISRSLKRLKRRLKGRAQS